MIHLIDGSAYIHRAYHALPPLTTSTGIPCGAIYGLTSTLAAILSNALSGGASHIAMVMDGGSDRRKAYFPDYKANRSAKPDDLKAQFPLARQACEAFGIATVSLAGEEADDVIATYATVAKTLAMPVTIYSGDKDLMQLVGGGVQMRDLFTSRMIDEAAVEAKFGVPPHLLREVLALMGDTADNIPGVPKIGPKTAAGLIQRYGSVENCIANARSLSGIAARNIVEYAAQARLSRDLVGLVTDLPVPPLMKLAAKRPDPRQVDDFLTSLEFTGLREEVVSRMELHA